MHSPRFGSRHRGADRPNDDALSEAPRACLLAAAAFGAALPLLAGAVVTYGETTDASLQALLAPTTDFTKPEPG